VDGTGRRCGNNDQRQLHLARYYTVLCAFGCGSYKFKKEWAVVVWIVVVFWDDDFSQRTAVVVTTRLLSKKSEILLLCVWDEGATSGAL
jgi:hypothetical protein